MSSSVNIIAHPVLLPFTHPMHMMGTTGVGAGLGFLAAGAAGAGPGALIGLATGFVQYPTEKLIEHFTNPDSNASEAAAMVAHAINCIASNALVWGGAALVGVVTAPVALGAGGFAAVYGTVSKLEDLALRLSGCTWKLPVVAILTAAVKIGLIAAGAFALVFFGVVAPPVGIALGVTASLLAIVGTYYVVMKIANAGLEESERNLKKAEESLQTALDQYQLAIDEESITVKASFEENILLINAIEAALNEKVFPYLDKIPEKALAKLISHLETLRDSLVSFNESSGVPEDGQELRDTLARRNITLPVRDSREEAQNGLSVKIQDLSVLINRLKPPKSTLEVAVSPLSSDRI